MKRMLGRLLKYGSLALGFVVCAGATYFYAVKPATAKPSSIKVDMSPARIERGRYVFLLADCDGCHSERDFSRFGGPVVATGRGKGFVFPKELGLPGTVAAPNITPDQETGIGEWTDGEKIRAIREGISRDGRPLFPMMLYEQYRNLSDEDVESLVAFMNTLRPVKNKVPRSEVKFPVSMLIRTAPKPAGHVPPSDRRSVVEYGRYLVTAAGCAHCHTGADGVKFAGGEEFNFPGMKVVSSNITPDKEAGIGSWTENYFVSRFQAYKPYVEKGAPAAAPNTFTVMPWLSYSQLEADDLKAIYAYIRTQPAASKRIDTHPPVLRAGGM